MRIAALSRVLLVVISSQSILSFNATAAELDAARLLDPTHVVEVVIDMPEGDWKRLCAQSRDFRSAFADPTAKPYSYFKGNVTIDGVTIKDVGLRKKGFIGSGDYVRPSLKIKFDEYVEQAPVEGLDRMTLNNNKQDRSLLSQALTYQLFRKAGVHAPRSTYATVTVNGEYLGIYSHVESIKKAFLKNEFGNSDGKLYEGTLADLYEKGIPRIEAKDKVADEDRATLSKLARLLYDENATLADVESMVDLDNFLKFWAVEGIIGFWDGYTQNQNNYFIYENPSNGKCYFIPWGADGCFGERSPFGGDGSVLRAESVLANRIFHLKGGAERYRAAVSQVLKEVWKEEELLAEVQRIEDMLFNDLSEQQLDHIEHAARVRSFIRDRRAKTMKELTKWQPSIPYRPRKPMYSVELGNTTGSFSTVWREESEPGTAKVAVKLDGEELQVQDVVVSVYEGQVRRFGPPTRGPSPAAPIAVLVICETKDGETMTLTLNVNRDDYVAKGKMQATGSLREGEQYGGFGGGKMLKGEVTLKESGTQNGDVIVGDFEATILEIRGGMMDRRRR